MSITTRKRLAFCISSLRAGGGTRVLVDLANWTADEGYEVDLLTLWPVGEYSTQISPNVRLVSLAQKRAALSIFPMMRYLRVTPPDALLATDELSHLIALGARMFTGGRVRIVLRIGNMFSILWQTHKRLQDRAIIPAISRWMYPKADAVVAVSAGVANDIATLFAIPRDRIRVIFSPKRIEEIAQAAKAETQHPWFLKKELPVLVTSSRLREQKDLPTLLHAFAALQKSVPSQLIIVGEGREKKHLQSLAHELGIEAMTDFVGYVENPHAYVARADVFVTTSRWEGLSNSLAEAVICGVPIVATDCDSGPREVLAPETDPLFRRREGVEFASSGVLIPVGGVQELTESLQNLLTNPALRDRYAGASARRAEAFDARHVLAQYLSVLLPA